MLKARSVPAASLQPDTRTTALLDEPEVCHYTEAVIEHPSLGASTCRSRHRHGDSHFAQDVRTRHEKNVQERAIDERRVRASRVQNWDR